ncbi:Protein Flattop [Echinococcus granulosus]|uniref:Cilia- and flagella-associated protein 126 n=1 Tax=Echinococcus granulosus TaxID=6210 RepID=A0A068WMA6_ECHGR|nr:Protein Flattop [Echinococcus granulosus]CDS20895.1 hypothetical protein EgrG_000525700 [Echinococcus granulosus]
MSKNYCAEQFEDAFTPKLSNYYGPTKRLPDHPRWRKVPTRIIANDRGHLAEAQDCVPGRNPFGHYHGIWDEPCHHPGNHCENTISRSAAGIAYLKIQKELYAARVKELQSKHDFISEREKKWMS